MAPPQQTTRWNHTAERFEFFIATEEDWGWADSKGNWVESTKYRERVATEDVKDENGNIIIPKGGLIITIIGKDNWQAKEMARLDYVNLMSGGVIVIVGDPEVEPQTQRPPICNKLEKEIDEFVNRDKHQQGGGGTHGLVHRFREQINGANGPGTPSWDTHDKTIKDQQNGLRKRLDEWNKNGCGPPPPTSWKWATAPAPSPNEWIGNRGPAGQQVNTAVKVAAGAATTVGVGYLVYRGLRLIPSLFFPPSIPLNLAIP